MLSTLFDQTVSTTRLEAGSGNRMVYDTLLTGLACAIQQADAKISLDLTGSFGKDWLMFCDVVDIKEGDRVTWNSEEYRVEAVDRLDFAGESHMEILIRLFKS